MFNFLKTIFTDNTEVQPAKTSEGYHDMFNITETNGRFFITDRHGNIAGSSNGYSRRRDAFRGAARSGIALA